MLRHCWHQEGRKEGREEGEEDAGGDRHPGGLPEARSSSFDNPTGNWGFGWRRV